MSGINSFNIPVGLLKRGTIVGYHQDSNLMDVQLVESQAVKGSRPLPVKVPAPPALFYNNGLFIGTLPAMYSTVVVGQGVGGQYYFVSHLTEDLASVPTVNLGELLIQGNQQTQIKLDVNNNITLGSSNNSLHLNTGSTKFPKTNLITLNFENENRLTQGYRSIGGLVKRDLRPNNQFDSDTKLENDDYDPYYKIIGLDPSSTSNDVIIGAAKNPPFIEHRELVYEFQYQSSVDDDISEANKYSTTNSFTNTVNFAAPNRRHSRADTLSLSLVAPNYLIETVKGTVIDIFGNILNLNRSPLPIGIDPNSTIKPSISTNQSQSFTNIKQIERKSLAYHFEINARKDPQPLFSQQSPPLDINADNYNAKLQRSRFHFDVDKEGLFKLNVPATSEVGNIPLLVRYENYSTFGTEDNNNPNKLWFRNDNLDIFLDSFASPEQTPDLSGGFNLSVDRGSIALMDGNANAAPLDRLTNTHIRHGQPFHDILQTCPAQQNNQTLNYQSQENVNPLDLSYIQPLTNVVSKTIRVSGNSAPLNGGANAGGRSGSINLDGSLEMSLGANTIDRQSLWLDTAGGIVANIGRDINQRSAILNMNGDVYMQIGGFGVSGDARFASLGQDGNYGAVLDLRVSSGGGYVHMIRCDQRGITIISPGYIALQAKGDLKISAGGNIEIEGAAVNIQQRMVLKNFGGSI